MTTTKQYETDLSNCISIVSKEWPLSKFKEFVSSFLTTTNDEDQWTFDYECYALDMGEEGERHSLHPKHWAPEFYQERWDDRKHKSKTIKE